MGNLRFFLKEIFIKLRDNYDNDYLNKNLINIFIVLVWNANKITKEKLRDIDIEEIERNKIYNFLKSNIPNQVLKDEMIIPIIYELLVNEREKRKSYGIYYTPQWLTEYIVDSVIVEDIKNRNDISSLKILEPSCGCGVFILYIFDVLYDWYISNTNLHNEVIIRKIIEENLYGVDIDKEALRVCRYLLMFKYSKITDKPLNLKFNLYNMDFLQDKILQYKDFDYIVGNPPYLENRKINKYYDKKSLKQRFTTAKGRFDIFNLFIERSIDIINENGKVGYILPASILSNNNFSDIRKIILESTNIDKIINLGEKIFDNVNMNMSILTMTKSHSAIKDHNIRCKDISMSNNRALHIKKDDYKIINQRYYYSLLKNIFDIYSSSITFKLRDRIFHEGYTKINDICEIIAGIATGNIRNKLLKTNKTKNSKRILEGKNIKKYYCKWDSLFFIDDKSIINKDNGEYATFMREEFIYSEKLLIRQTADRFICAYDNNNYYLLNTLYSLIIRSKYRKRINIKYILGLLNSKLYSYLYRSMVRETNKLFPQVKIFHIQNSPVIIPESFIENEVVNRVDKILKYNENLYNEENLKNSNKLEGKIKKLMTEIDTITYKIFNLTDREICEVEKGIDNI